MNATVHLTPEALDQLAERVIELLEERGLLQLPAEQANPYLDVDQAAALLKAKKQRVYDLVHAGRLPRCGDGRRLLLRRADVLAHIERAA